MRARSKQSKDMERQALYQAMKEEKRLVFNTAYFDKENREIVSLIDCVTLPIERGEVLFDSYGDGSQQRLK